MAVDSIAATVFDEWGTLIKDTMLAKVAVEREGKQYPAYLSRDKRVSWLINPETFPAEDFVKAPVAARNELLVSSFELAISNLVASLGPDVGAWQYGQTKHSEIIHPLGDLVNEVTQAQLAVEPIPKGGSVDTVNLAYFDDTDNQRAGPSFRIIVDTRDWDLTVGTNTPGQSGDSRDPHYKDLFTMWGRGDYFPAYYSRKKIEENASLIIEMTPKKQ